MQLTAPIISLSPPDDPILLDFKKKFRRIGVAMAHPYQDGLIFSNNQPIQQGDWSEYEIMMAHYDCIADARVHIVVNNKGRISNEMAREISFAMLKNKPIIMMHTPVFEETVEWLYRLQLAPRDNKFIYCDLNILDDDDTLACIESSAAKSVSYQLTNSEIRRINYSLKVYFRELLSESHLKKAMLN